YFVDRRKYYLESGGLSSTELEAMVLQHPDIREAAAYEVRPAETAGTAVALAVVAARALDPDVLWPWLRSHLPHDTQPRLIRVVDRLPRNAVGRVQKYQLTAEGIPPSTWEQPTAEIGVRP